MLLKRKALGVISLTWCILAATFAFLPLYLWESGLPQIGHGLGALLTLWSFINGFWKAPRTVKVALVFAMYAVTVNSLMYIKYQDYQTILSALYYSYNVALMGAIIGVAHHIGARSFFRVVRSAFAMWLVLESLIIVGGLGRVFGEFRAMGTFNDPNQFAHWVLWAVIGVAISGFYLSRSMMWGWVAFALGVFLLILSASRSGLLGMVVIGLALMYSATYSLLRFCRKGKCRLHLRTLVLGGLVLGAFLGIISIEGFRMELGAQAEKFLGRVTHGLDKGEENLIERGYDRILLFPEYLILGAGEGANERWAGKTTFLGEIHSTPAGVLFYYGIPGSVLFVLMLWSVWQMLPLGWMRLMLLAPLFYSLGTYNLRNSFFWLGLAILYVAGRVLRDESFRGARSGIVANREHR